MRTILSKDGTKIAFDQETAYLAELLAPYFTVINYDRRGRGDSGDTQPYVSACELAGQTYEVAAEGLTPPLIDFFCE